jgi:hypothetical protein
LACHLQIDADPDPAYHFDADPHPNPAYHVDTDPDPTFQFVRIQIHNAGTHNVGPYCTKNRLFFSAMKHVNYLRVGIAKFSG